MSAFLTAVTAAVIQSDADDDADERSNIPPWHRRSPFTPSPSPSPMPYSPPSPIPQYPVEVSPMPSSPPSPPGAYVSTITSTSQQTPDSTVPSSPTAIPISGIYSFLVNPRAPRVDAQGMTWRSPVVLMESPKAAPSPVVLMPSSKARPSPVVLMPAQKRPKLAQTPKPMPRPPLHPPSAVQIGPRPPLHPPSAVQVGPRPPLSPPTVWHYIQQQGG